MKEGWSEQSCTGPPAGTGPPGTQAGTGPPGSSDGTGPHGTQAGTGPPGRKTGTDPPCGRGSTGLSGGKDGTGYPGIMADFWRQYFQAKLVISSPPSFYEFPAFWEHSPSLFSSCFSISLFLDFTLASFSSLSHALCFYSSW